MTDEQPTTADVLEAIRDFRADVDRRFEGIDRRFADVDQQFVELSTDVNAHLRAQDQQMTDLITFLKVRFDNIDARLEELASTRPSVEMPQLRQRVS